MTDSPRNGDGEGHTHRFQPLWDDCSGLVAAYFQRKGFPRERVEDLTQVTFLRVYKGLKGYRQDARPCTWVISIARNLWLNELRFQNAAKRQGTEIPIDHPESEDGSTRERSVVESLTQDESADPESELLAKERRVRIGAAIQRLPERMRLVFLLYLQGLSYRQVARLAECEVGTVKSHLHQARQRLREELDTVTRA